MRTSARIIFIAGTGVRRIVRVPLSAEAVERTLVRRRQPPARVPRARDGLRRRSRGMAAFQMTPRAMAAWHRWNEPAQPETSGDKAPTRRLRQALSGPGTACAMSRKRWSGMAAGEMPTTKPRVPALGVRSLLAPLHHPVRALRTRTARRSAAPHWRDHLVKEVDS